MALPKPKPDYARQPSVPPGTPNIFEAAENNDVVGLERALEFYDVNSRDEIGMTPLHYAASTLSGRTVNRLLAHPGIDATLADEFGRSAATLALECWPMLATNLIKQLNPHCYPWLYPASE